jgi:HSP20 family protein
LVEEFHRRSNEMLDELMRQLSAAPSQEPALAFIPHVDLVEGQWDIRVYISIPGLVEDDITIDIDRRSLVVRGERRPPYDPERRGPQIREWRYGFFERHVRLPGEVEPDGIRAVYESGVLTIVIPKVLGEDAR